MNKTTILLIISLFLLIKPAKLFASTSSVETTIGGTKVADVTGVVTLQVQRKTFPEILVDLFAGADTKIRKKKQIKVSGDYTGGSVINLVSVEEDGKASEYSFEIPVISSVMNLTTEKLVKEVSRFQSVQMIFTNANNVPDAVAQTSHKFQAGAISNSRLGADAAVQGSFAEAGAKGRFLLMLDFDLE